jgi:leader peptidase (prepilin peptidase) / N-methyltransferase
MARLNGGGLRRVSVGAEEWAWPAGLVLLYAVPAVVAWGAGGPVPAVAAALSLLLAAGLIALTEIDRTSLRLPDRLTLSLLALGLVAAALTGGGLLWHLFSAILALAAIVLVGEAYRALRGTDGIGMGDAKLFAASGAWLGAGALPSVLLWACASALAVLLLVRAMGQPLNARTAIPFGPFLAFGTWIVWCLGPLS